MNKPVLAQVALHGKNYKVKKTMANAKVGTMVFRSDLGRFFILTQEDPSDKNNWKTESKQEPQWGSF